MHTALIVDDERIARQRLRSLLQKHEANINIIGEAENGKEAIEKIELLKPDIVFLDIQMPEISGIELIHHLSHLPYIIFVTAFHDHAIKAFEQNAVDYLLKPVEPERLEKSIEKVLQRTHSMESQAKLLTSVLQQMQQETKKLDTIPVPVAQKILLIPVETVVYFEARQKYVYIHTVEQEFLIDYTLTFLEERLPADFLRIHRTFIVNRKMIKEIHKHFKGSYLFIMKNKAGAKLTSGNTFNAVVKELLHM